MAKNTVLVVEDDSSIRESMQLFLELEGYKVLTAANGKEALTVLTANPEPCVILLDLFMPVMDGAEFLERLGQDHPYTVAHVPIVLVSAASATDELLQKVKPKTRGFLKKPVDLDMITKILDSCGCAP